ncbi:hypothetical protein [Sphingopyxis sp. PET50]|uniref:hypothetical protein n=1 Tax=Sphingopyxis sp. PET50 TaxID=2976533 RepID=UPI0021AFB8FC|nr:hypothetical protein [Sphingopyxis sp. PET50]
MTRIFTSDQDATGDLPAFETLASYRSAIGALTGLRAWYSPWSPDDRIDVSTKISQLDDLSGNGFHLVQATDANRPLIGENAFGAINGTDRDGMDTSGASALYLETVGNVFDGTGDWTYAVLCKPESTAGCVISSTGTQIINQNSATNLRMNGTQLSVTSPTSIQNKICKILATHSFPGAGNVSLWMEVNGVTGTATPAGSGSVPGTNHLRVGIHTTPSTGLFDAIYGDIIIIKGIADADDLQLIRDYFSFLYDLRS